METADFLLSFEDSVATLRVDMYSSTESGVDDWTGLTFTSRPNVSRRFSFESFPIKKMQVLIELDQSECRVS